MNDETSSIPTQKQSGNSLGIPLAIVIAAGLIAAAIYFGGNENPAAVTGTQDAVNEPETQVTPEITVAPVTEDDHIRGNPNAPIVMVEYSDYDCPFCKNYHETMNRIMDEYGTDGKVAWVYRHFPLEQLHANAPAIAAASECVAELGGNDAFWEFSDLIFGERLVNELTNPTRLPEYAVSAGVNASAFEECVASGRHNAAIVEDVQQAIAAGGQGTPHTIVLVGDQRGVINGAQPYESVKQIVENLLSQIESPAPSAAQ